MLCVVLKQKKHLFIIKTRACVLIRKVKKKNAKEKINKKGI